MNQFLASKKQLKFSIIPRFRIKDLRFRNLLPVFIFLILISCIINPKSILAVNPNELSQKIEQVRKERESLLEEQKRLQQELETINKEALTLGTAVKSLDATRKKLATDINVTQSKINSTSLTISSLDGTIKEKEYQISTHRQAIADTLALLSERDKKPLVMSLLASVRLADIWGDSNHLEDLTKKLEEEINNLRETRIILSQEKIEKEQTVKAQANLKAQLDGQKSIVEENKKAKEKLLAQTKSEEVAYQSMLRDNLARQQEFEADLFKLESELKITLDPTLLPTARPGVLAWPLDKVYITQRFGKTAASGRLYASGSHNGIDLRATQGTAVKAMLSGVVEGTGNTDEQRGCGSYGGWILVRHNNGLSSIYGHLSARLVQKGQSVETGEVIGYSGGMPGVFGSGYSTGQHLHLGLFASQGVSVQQFVTSRNCKQIFVPIADVKAYLDPLAYLPSL